MTEEISDEEFQILKNKLTENVKDYLKIDEEISALNKAIRERRKKKTEFSNSILEYMKKIDIHHMNIKDGRLVYNVTNTKQGLNKKNLITGLNKCFNEEKALEIANIILENRSRVERVSLKKVKIKNSIDIPN